MMPACPGLLLPVRPNPAAGDGDAVEWGLGCPWPKRRGLRHSSRPSRAGTLAVHGRGLGTCEGDRCLRLAGSISFYFLVGIIGEPCSAFLYEIIHQLVPELLVLVLVLCQNSSSCAYGQVSSTTLITSRWLRLLAHATRITTDNWRHATRDNSQHATTVIRIRSRQHRKTG